MALHFASASSQQRDYGDVALLNPLSNWSMHIRVNLDDLATNHYLMAKRTASPGAGFLWVFLPTDSATGNTNCFKIFIQNPIEFATSPSNSAVAGQWQSVGYSRHRNTLGGLKLYVDGVEVASADANDSDFTNNTESLRVAAQQSGQHMNGALDEAAIWQGVLLPEEFALLGQGYSAKFIRPHDRIFYDKLEPRSIDEARGLVGADVNGPIAVAKPPPIIFPPKVLRRDRIFVPAGAAEGAGSAAGAATVTGEGAATAAAAGEAAGAATVTGAAGGDVEGAGQAAGQAAVSGEGAATAAAAGQAAGQATATGTADPGGAAPAALVEAPRFLVEIELDSGTVRLWNGIGTLTALGESWTGAGRLVSVSPIRETQDVVAAGVVLQLAIVPIEEIPDAPDAFLNIALAEEYQGRPVTIYQARLDPDTLALTADPFVRFKGRLDVMEDVEIPGAALLRVSAENRLIDLERPKKRTYTPEDQKAFHPGDTFFDEVAALQNREVVLE